RASVAKHSPLRLAGIVPARSLRSERGRGRPCEISQYIARCLPVNRPPRGRRRPCPRCDSEAHPVSSRIPREEEGPMLEPSPFSRVQIDLGWVRLWIVLLEFTPQV